MMTMTLSLTDGCFDDDGDDDDDDDSWLDGCWKLPGSVARQAAAAATCVSRTNTLLPLIHKYTFALIHKYTFAFHTQIHPSLSYTNTLLPHIHDYTFASQHK